MRLALDNPITRRVHATESAHAFEPDHARQPQLFHA